MLKLKARTQQFGSLVRAECHQLSVLWPAYQLPACRGSFHKISQLSKLPIAPNPIFPHRSKRKCYNSAQEWSTYRGVGSRHCLYKFEESPWRPRRMNRQSRKSLARRGYQHSCIHKWANSKVWSSPNHCGNPCLIYTFKRQTENYLPLIKTIASMFLCWQSYWSLIIRFLKCLHE